MKHENYHHCGCYAFVAGLARVAKSVNPISLYPLICLRGGEGRVRWVDETTVILYRKRTSPSHCFAMGPYLSPLRAERVDFSDCQLRRYLSEVTTQCLLELDCRIP